MSADCRFCGVTMLRSMRDVSGEWDVCDRPECMVAAIDASRALHPSSKP